MCHKIMQKSASKDFIKTYLFFATFFKQTRSNIWFQYFLNICMSFTCCKLVGLFGFFKWKSLYICQIEYPFFNECIFFHRNFVHHPNLNSISPSVSDCKSSSLFSYLLSLPFFSLYLIFMLSSYELNINTLITYDIT